MEYPGLMSSITAQKDLCLRKEININIKSRICIVYLQIAQKMFFYVTIPVYL